MPNPAQLSSNASSLNSHQSPPMGTWPMAHNYHATQPLLPGHELMTVVHALLPLDLCPLRICTAQTACSSSSVFTIHQVVISQGNRNRGELPLPLAVEAGCYSRAMPRAPARPCCRDLVSVGPQNAKGPAPLTCRPDASVGWAHACRRRLARAVQAAAARGARARA